MEIVEDFVELQEKRAGLDAPVGLVPTMGFLHEGHLSLVRAARTSCTGVVVTVFVNPAQFGPGEDLETYPRDLDRDLSLLSREAVDLVWVPTAEALYPAGYQTWVTVKELTRGLEGKSRPHHFDGVTTVVAKLLNAVRPDRLFLGQKDAQQVAVVKRMMRDLNYPTEIIVGPIRRADDGLALSSRNARLTAAQRKAATVLYRSLSRAARAFEKGERRAGRLREIVEETCGREPLVSLEYVSCAHPLTLQEWEGSVEDRALLSLAATVGAVRLIDNQTLEEAPCS